jgi:hypothetical protein
LHNFDKLTIMNFFLQFMFIVGLELPGAPAGSIQHIPRRHTGFGVGAQTQHSAYDYDNDGDDHNSCGGHGVTSISVERRAQLLRDFQDHAVRHFCPRG